MSGLSIKSLWPKISRPFRNESTNRINEIRLKDIITLDEAAIYLGFEPKVIAEEARAGHLPAGQIAGQWRFNRWALIEYFALPHTHELKTAAVFCQLEDVAQFLREVAQGETMFDSINLCGANLSGADLSKVVFNRVNLSYADLSHATLQEVELQDTTLYKANLSGANLTYAELEGADLGEANLSNATLVGTNLEGANLRGVDISGARFQDVII